MPYKFNADRRDKIPKQKHRVTNWAEYNESLRRRGDLTVGLAKRRSLCGRRRAGRSRVDSLSIQIWRLRPA